MTSFWQIHASYTLLDVSRPRGVGRGRAGVSPLWDVYSPHAFPKGPLKGGPSRGVTGVASLRDTDVTHTLLEASGKRRLACGFCGEVPL